MQNYITIGRVGKSYGIKGWFKVISFANPADNILNYPTWLFQYRHGIEPVVLEGCRRHGGTFIAKIKGCDTPEGTRAFTNVPILIPAADLAPLPEGEYYWSDLVGLEVIDSQQKNLGIVEELVETGSHDVMIVQGKVRHLIPYSAVQSVSLKDKRIIVDWDPNF
jgi:16S rRNA processing protein RimM